MSASESDTSDVTYAYRPSLVGAAWVLALTRDGIAWQRGQHSGLVPYESVRHVRLSYRPATMQSHRFLTDIWADNAPKLQIASCTWRGVAELARQDAAYVDFVAELHRKLAAAGSTATFTSGTPRILFFVGLAVFAVAIVALLATTVRAVLAGDWKPAMVVSGFFAIFLWQLVQFFRRNWPRVYRPDQVPPQALPRV